ncbi:MAG TPA: SGNH/GDSL hydrolase family protein [Polyangiaceae bacterium]|nr:SGNH/GDSL hydrolase family protein [Polyangiaceae bacterium]
MTAWLVLGSTWAAAASSAIGAPTGAEASSAHGVHTSGVSEKTKPSPANGESASNSEARPAGAPGAANAHAETPARAGTEPPLPEGTTVLHIGDSFAGALGPDLNREFAARGVKGVLKQQKATYIPTWASHKELGGYLERYHPDLILVTLGANELEIPRPEDRIDAIGRLVRRFGEVPCVWIGIPLWKGANPHLLEVIKDHVAPCRYLDSNALVPDLERAKDKIHPSLPARKIWAEAVVGWLAHHRVPNADRPWLLQDQSTH